MAKIELFHFLNKKPPRRLILLNESAETSCVISSEVNPNMGILIRGLLTTKVFIARRNVVQREHVTTFAESVNL